MFGTATPIRTACWGLAEFTNAFLRPEPALYPPRGITRFGRRRLSKSDFALLTPQGLSFICRLRSSALSHSSAPRIEAFCAAEIEQPRGVGFDRCSQPEIPRSADPSDRAPRIHPARYR